MTVSYQIETTTKDTDVTHTIYTTYVELNGTSVVKKYDKGNERFIRAIQQ